MGVTGERMFFSLQMDNCTFCLMQMVLAKNPKLTLRSVSLRNALSRARRPASAASDSGGAKAHRTLRTESR